MIKKFNVKKTKQLKIVNSILRLICRKPIRKSCQLSEYKEIIIIDFSLIGDMVMNIPFLKQIRKNCPNARITMIVRKQSIAVLESQGLVDNFIEFDGKELLFSPVKIIRNIFKIKIALKKVNRKYYDMAIEPKGDLRHIWFMHFINAGRTVSYNYTGGEYLITDSYEPLIKTEHLIDEKIDLLELSGFVVDRNESTPLLECKAEKRNEKYIIGIHPGASCKNKMYRHFGIIIDYIAGFNKNTIIHVFKDPFDNSEITDGIIESIERNNLEYQIVSKELNEYIDAVYLCNLMICNDSSAGHIAAAYGIPAIVIFGAVKPETARPRGSKVICISHKCDCKPCTLDDCPNGRYECLEKIDLNEIYKALEEMIEKRQSSIS